MKQIVLMSKHILSKQIHTLQNIWVIKDNIFNCLLSFLMEKHKVQRNYITKLLVSDSKNNRKKKRRSTEKIKLLGSTRKSGFMMEKGLRNKTFKED